MANRIGQQLGNYRLTKLLGTGGFAEVYLGEHIHLGTQAALKVLHTQLTEKDVDTFRVEAHTIARLIHANIVRVLDFGVEGKTPFLVMDYAPNGTMRQRHPRGTPLPLPAIISYVKQVAEALQYAHDEKLIHRDIKPENMLIGRRNDILLSDFGIALVAQSSRYQSTQDVVGTVAYMSPEQIQGKPRPASDQYSLAIVVYEWLTGDRPFHGSFIELCTQHLMASPPPLREKVADIPADVEQVVLTALAKDPHRRFESVQAFAAAISQATQAPQRPQAAPPPIINVSQPVPPTGRVTRLTQPAKAAEWILLHMFQGHTWEEYTGGVSSVAISEDGQTLVSASSDNTIKVWNLHSGQLLRTLEAHSRHYAQSIAISRDGQTLVSGHWGGEMNVKVWNLHSGQLLRALEGHGYAVMSVAISEDGQTVASGSHDWTIKVWNLHSGQLLRTLKGHTQVVMSVAIGSQILVSASPDNTIKVWNLHSGQLLRTLEGHDPAAISRDGQILVNISAYKLIKVWNLRSGQLLHTLKGHTTNILHVVISGDGQTLASGGYDNVVKVWNLHSGQLLHTLEGHTKYIYALAISKNGQTLVSGGEDGTIKVWVRK